MNLTLATSHAAAAADSLKRTIDALNYEMEKSARSADGGPDAPAEIRELQRLIRRTYRDHEAILGLLAQLSPEIFGRQCDRCGSRVRRLYQSQDGAWSVCAPCAETIRQERLTEALRRDLAAVNEQIRVARQRRRKPATL